ncbi:MAG: DUF2934 domain-containing protein [Thermodesulfobacteria bacterium]|nr:DUF2934 domain-containing protein [Thermodesulfobacteriota bacterium]
MKKERILKKDWPSFLKRFNAEQQFRPVRVLVGGQEICRDLPFMGLVYEDKKKDIELFVGGVDVERPTHLMHTLVSPRAIYVLKENGDVRGIEIQSAKDPNVTVEFIGPPEEAQRVKRELIEKIAYELYLRRGKEPGKALDDWLKAEKLVEKVASLYV